MADAAGAMDLGGGALGGMGGGGGGKSGGGGGGGDMTDPMSGMGMGGDSSFGGGGLSDLAGGGSPFGFGETPSSFGGNIASQAQAAQDPTGTTGAQQSIEASQPSPGTPGGGIGGTQTGPQSLGQLAQGTGQPMGAPSQPFSVPTTAVQPEQAPTTPIPGSQPTGPAGGITPTPTPTPPYGASGAGAFGGPPSDFASQFRSDVNQINLQNPEQPLQSAINQTMPGTADVGGPDQPAAPATPPAPTTDIAGPGDTGFGKLMASPGGEAGAPGPAPDDTQISNAAAKGDRLPATFDQRFPSTLQQLATQPMPSLPNPAATIGDVTGSDTFPPNEQQYAGDATQPKPPEAQPKPTEAQPKQQIPKTTPRTQQPRAAAPRAPAPHAAHPAYRTDPYGNTYTTQPGYQPSPMSPLPAYPPPGAAAPRAAAPRAIAPPAPRAAAPPAPGETPAQAAAANTPTGQAMTSAMSQLPTRTLLQLATAAGVPVPPQLALAMGGQPPPLQTIPRSGTLPPGARPIGAAPTAPTTPSAPAAARPGDTAQGYNYYQGRGMRMGSVPTQTVNTPYGPIRVSTEAAGDFQGALQDLKDEGAPIKKFGSYNERPKAFGRGPSSHGYGAAIDIDDEQDLSPAMRQWDRANPGKLDQILSDHNLGRPIPNRDPGHIEWRGPGGSREPIAAPRLSDAEKLGIKDIPTAGPVKSPEQVMQDFGSNVDLATGITKAAGPQNVERTIRGLEEGGATPRAFEDERGFEQEASDATPRTFAERFPPWANDPNFVERFAAGQAPYVMKMDDAALAQALANIRSGWLPGFLRMLQR